MMTPLWLALAALSALALAFLLWPLRRKGTASQVERVRRQYLEANVSLFREHLAELEAGRDAGRLSREAFEQLKLEQERALLKEERELAASKPVRGRALPGGPVVIAVAAVCVLGSLGLYQLWGASDDVRLAQMRENKEQLDREEQDNDERVDPGRTWALIEALQERLEENPESTQHLFLLAHYSRELGHFDQAMEAYQRIIDITPDDAAVRAEMAETLFIRDDNRIGERAQTLIDEALRLDPEETTALGLAGIDAFSNRDYRAAIDYWEQALAVMNPRSANAMAFQRGIERARQALGNSGADGASEDEESAAEAQIEIPVRVELSGNIDFEGDEWVFVYARAAEGSPMPLAITRLQARELPTSIVLDDTMAMSSSASLAGVESVELVARLSRSGDASPQPGDWQGTLGPLDPADNPDEQTLVIDEPIAE